MTQTEQQERPVETVDFGPDQGNLLLDRLRPAQALYGIVGVVALWLATLGGNLRVMAAVGGLVTLPCVLAAVLRVPYTGKYLDQIIGPWLRWRWWKLSGKDKRRPITSAHWLGDRLVEPEQTPPPELAHVRLVGYEDPHGRKVGLVYDRLEKTYTVVMRIEASEPGIGGRDHLDKTLRGWERVLDNVAKSTHRAVKVRRFQWLLVSTPDDGTRLHADYQARAVVKDGPLAEMYEELTEQAGPTSTLHETYLAIQVDEQPASDDHWVDGSAYVASASAAVKAARDVAHSLNQTSYRVVKETLEPGELGRLVHLLYCPQQRTHLDQQHVTGLPLGMVWPKQGSRPWDSVITDGAMHRVWELAWPEQQVGAWFLDEMAVLPGVSYALSVVYQPLLRDREIDTAENKRSGAIAKDQTRAGLGFLKRRKTEEQEEVNEGYLGQLLAGHESFRVTAWAAVSAFVSQADLDDLANWVMVRDRLVFADSRAVRNRMAAGELALKTAAADARVALVPRDGVHAQALTNVLPFCRGTDGSWL